MDVSLYTYSLALDLLKDDLLTSSWGQPASWVCDLHSHSSPCSEEGHGRLNALLFCLEILNKFTFEFVFC